MKRTAFVIAFLLTAVSCATMQQGSTAHVGRAVQALGGADALAAIKTIATKGTMRQWEPEQSMVAGGDMRFACESTFEAVTDVGPRAARIDWVRNFAYPAPRTFRFTEIVTPDAGYVAGIDSNGRTKQSQDSNPPAHSMSGLRLTATQRELIRTSPLLFLEMHRSPDRVKGVTDVPAGGATYPAVEYRGGEQTDGSREVHAYAITPNPHAEGLLIGYLPEARLGFATDIWSPGAGPLPDKLNPALAALVAGVKKAGISPQKFAGGHGSVADYAPLAGLQGK